jgi:hypothetical protein
MLRSSTSSLLIISLLALPCRGADIPFTVKETAGLRRFSYPVEASFTLPRPLVEGDRFRLFDPQDKPVAAQISRAGTRQVTVDFNLSVGPNESRKFALHYGANVEPGPSPKGSMKVETTDKEFLVRHGGLTFAAPKDLLGLLRSVQDAKGNDWLRPISPGLLIWYKDDSSFRAGGLGARGAPTQASVTRSGPLAVSIRFEGTQALPGNREVASRVDLTWPSSKSWVRVDWKVEDPNGLVGGLGADLHLNLGDGPTLVDFGAGSYVYTTLKKGEAAKLVCDRHTNVSPDNKRSEVVPSWEVLTGPPNALQPLASSHRDRAEGWAHVMDCNRCTAVAIERFGDRGDAIAVEADGRLTLRTRFPVAEAIKKSANDPAPGPKKLTFWLHFVSMPVQVGALTSPQSMQAPLEVTADMDASK